MDIMELGAIGELVGGVAVLATLVYLAIQIRQNTASNRLEFRTLRTDRRVDQGGRHQLERRIPPTR